MIQHFCTHCGGAFAVDETTSVEFFACPYCAGKNNINRRDGFSPIVVAELAETMPMHASRSNANVSMKQAAAEDESSPRLAVLAAITLGAIGLLAAILVGAGVLVWMVLKPDSTPPIAHELTEAQVAPTDDAKQQSPSTSVNSVADIRDNHDGAGLENRTADSSKPQSNSVASDRRSPHVFPTRQNVQENPSVKPVQRTNPNGIKDSAYHYFFKADHRYNYSLSMMTKMNDVDVSVTAVVVYSPNSSDQTSIDPELMRGVPADIRDRHQFQQMACTSTSFLRISSSPTSPNHGHWSGDLLIDDTGKLIASNENPGVRDNNSMIPLLFIPAENLALIDFPDAGERSWQEQQSIQQVIINLDNLQERDTSPFASLNRQLRRYQPPRPSGYYDPYGRRGDLYDPFGRRRDVVDDIEVKSLSIDIVSDCKVESEDETKVIVKRRLVGKPGDESKIKVNLEREEIITFDKKQQLVTLIESTGTTAVTLDNITITVPTDYTLKLDKVATPDELVAARMESEKRSQAFREKYEEERKKRDSAKAAEIAATENLNAENNKLLYANFQKEDYLSIRSMAFSNDGKRLATGDSSGQVSVFDLEKKRRVEFVDCRESLGQVTSITFSSDGKRLLTGGYSGRIEVWKVDEVGFLESVGKFVGHTSEIKCIAIDPTGKFVLSGEREKVARLWNLSSQKEILSVDDFTNAVIGAGFTDRGQTGVVCCQENAIYINLEKGEIERKRKSFRKHSAFDIAFSTDGSNFAVSHSYDIDVFETDTASKINTLKGSNISWKIAFTADGNHILAGENNLSIWDIDQGTRVNEFSLGQHINVQSVAASPDGRFITGMASITNSGISVFENPLAASWGTVSVKVPATALDSDSDSPSAVEAGPDTPPVVHCEFPDQGWGVDALCFSPDSRYLYAGKYGLTVYDIIKKREIDRQDRAIADGVTVIATSPDGTRVLTGLSSGKILIWEVSSRGQLENVGKFVGHTSKVEAIVVAADNKTVISGENKRARIWNLDTQKEDTSLEFKRSVSSCQFLPNGRAALASDGSSLTILKIPEAKVWKQYDNIGHGTHSAFSADGKRLATANGYDIQLYDAQTAGETSSLSAGESVWTLAFHPDGKHLLSGGRGKVSFWDIEKQTKVAELDVPTSYVQCIAISKDGKFVAAIPGSAGQTLTIFNTPLDEE